MLFLGLIRNAFSVLITLILSEPATASTRQCLDLFQRSDVAVQIWETSPPVFSYGRVPILRPKWKIPQSNYVESIAVATDAERIFFGGRNGSAVVADFQGLILSKLIPHTAWIGQVASSRDGRIFITASFDKTCRFHDSSGRTIFKIDHRYSGFSHAAITPSGGLAVCGTENGPVAIVNLRRNFKTTWVDTKIGDLHKLQISSDGHVILAAGRSQADPYKNRVHVFGNTGEVISSYEDVNRPNRPPNNRVSGAAIGPGNHFVITSFFDRSVHVLDLTSSNLNEFFVSPTGHPTAYLEALTLSPDGKIIIAGFYDNAVYLANRDGQIIRRIPEADYYLPGNLMKIYASPDNRHFITVNAGSLTPDNARAGEI